MRRGRVYTSSNLSRIHRVEPAAVVLALDELVDRGVLRTCLNSRKLPGYCLVEAAILPVPADSARPPRAVATRPITRCLDGALSGYETGIATHRALAMLARR